MELKFDPENPIYTHVTDENQANLALDELEKEKSVGVDVECTSLDPYDGVLLTIQIGTPFKSFIFDARELNLSDMQRFR